MFDPLTRIGSAETFVQSAGEARLVADCKVNPATLVGHVKMKSAPEGMIVTFAGMQRLVQMVAHVFVTLQF